MTCSGMSHKSDGHPVSTLAGAPYQSSSASPLTMCGGGFEIVIDSSSHSSTSSCVRHGPTNTEIRRAVFAYSPPDVPNSSASLFGRYFCCTITGMDPYADCVYYTYLWVWRFSKYNNNNACYSKRGIRARPGGTAVAELQPTDRLSSMEFAHSINGTDTA